MLSGCRKRAKKRAAEKARGVARFYALIEYRIEKEKRADEMLRARGARMVAEVSARVARTRCHVTHCKAKPLPVVFSLAGTGNAVDTTEARAVEYAERAAFAAGIRADDYLTRGTNPVLIPASALVRRK